MGLNHVACPYRRVTAPERWLAGRWLLALHALTLGSNYVLFSFYHHSYVPAQLLRVLFHLQRYSGQAAVTGVHPSPFLYQIQQHTDIYTFAWWSSRSPIFRIKWLTSLIYLMACCCFETLRVAPGCGWYHGQASAAVQRRQCRRGRTVR